MMEIRIARHTAQLEEILSFYRDGIGLREAGRFHDHAGYDGVFLATGECGTHLEFTTGGDQAPPTPHPESLLVLYLENEASVQAVMARLGANPVTPANPYWSEHGTTLEDPDGFRVVLVPESWRG
jgi:catechol 2,3-dioxygenase-like lactoylglutathione lyase family enzyme